MTAKECAFVDGNMCDGFFDGVGGLLDGFFDDECENYSDVVGGVKIESVSMRSSTSDFVDNDVELHGFFENVSEKATGNEIDGMNSLLERC